jgi:polar amino acid transport system ATP-binding protein
MTSAQEPVVSVRGVSKSFGATEVLSEVSVDVPRGEVLCIIGRSGSGKSTLLRSVNHLERPTSGYVVVDGEVMGYRRQGNLLRELPPRGVARQRRRVGMVFQHFNLFPHLTAIQNVCEAPVRVLRRAPHEVAEEARAALRSVGLEGHEEAFPGQLSGGQQQRVAIARALAMKPVVMLFDEPTSALDPELVGGVLETMRGLAKTGMTMLIVTHEIAFARSVADHVMFLEGGRLVEYGTAEQVIGSPRETETREFLSHVL